MLKPPDPSINVDPGVDYSMIPWGRVGAVALLLLVLAIAWKRAPRVLLVIVFFAALLMIGAKL